MKVILLKDVKKVGIKNSIIEASDGYAINYLFPNKIAEAATPEKIAQIKNASVAHANEKIMEDEKLAQKLSALKGEVIEIPVRATPKGGLFKSIGKTDIIKTIKAQKKIDLPESVVVLEQPIKKAGEHIIELESGNKHSTITVSIIASA